MSGDHLKPDTHLIKHSVALRAKYASMKHLDPTYISCMQIVPHPSNNMRGFSIPVARTQKLAGMILEDGYDAFEALRNGVCVEISPAEKGTSPNRFDDHFVANTGNDPNHAVRMDSDPPTEYGSLSHSTLNVLYRNILGMQFGCSCDRTVAEFTCKCKAGPILNVGGFYGRSQLIDHNETWHHDILAGLKWYVLDSEIEKDIGACEIIATALKKTNGAAMATGHLEIMRTVVGLCTPSPQGEIVPFGPVRAVILELFGSSADHPNLVDCFHIVQSVVGRDSPLIKEFFDFCIQFVDESYRKFRLEAYSVVTSIPLCFPRLRFMLLKTCWCTPVSRTSDLCIVPPRKQMRFTKSGYHRVWTKLYEEIESEYVCFEFSLHGSG